MLNSPTILLAFVIFLLFGYLSLIRLLAKQSFAGRGIGRYFKELRPGSVLRNLGSSAFFISLPATSLLLFWGWGPALLWLIIFHLMIESLCHLQFSAQPEQDSVADHLLRARRPFIALLEQGLIQAFFLLSMGVVTALLATLVDRQSGLLFAILFLLPARALLRHSSRSMPLLIRIAGGIALMVLGLALSDQLGFSVYGDWAPFGDNVDWLRFNNPTVIAAVLVVAVFRMEQDRGFKNDLATFAGLIIVILSTLIVVRLLILQPVLDAPLNSAQASSDSLPSFAILSLFIFAGFTALLIRLLIEEDNDAEHSPVQFSRLQIGGFLHLVFLLVLGLSLASAVGIGAWKTHYVDWNEQLNLLDHLNLAITSAQSLIDTNAQSGTLIHTLLLAALCFTGFSFMLTCADQLTLEEREKETLFSVVLEAKVLQALLIFVSSAYFISHGIDLNTWLLIGILGWILVTHLLMGMTLAMPGSGRRTIFSAVCGLLLVIGAGQAIATSLLWLIEGKYVFAGISLFLISVAALLWSRSVPSLLRRFESNQTDDLF